MSDGAGFELTPEAPKRARGRPKGSVNKRSQDLADYIAAQIGSTPGQQAAAVALVTQREISRAGKVARQLGLPATIVALSVKARAMANLLSCSPAEAWEMMRKERSELMGYVHQKQPMAIAVKGQLGPAVIVMGQVGAMADAIGQGFDIEGDFEALPSPVGNVQSDGEAKGQ